MAIAAGEQIVRPFDFRDQLRRKLKSTAAANAVFNGDDRNVLSPHL
jgi:hypothetical protein